MTKLKEISSLGIGELESKFKELKKELMKQNTQVASGTVPKSPGHIKQTKKTIAKILMLIKQKKDDQEIKKGGTKKDE